MGLAFDSGGSLYVADYNNNAIRKVSPLGVVSTLAGSPTQASGAADGTGAGATFNNPHGVAVDAAHAAWTAFAERTQCGPRAQRALCGVNRKIKN